jgi:predicted NAD/FAD-binding protein
MLSDRSDRERAVLGDIRYAPNVVYLHRDIRLMPKRRRACAASLAQGHSAGAAREYRTNRCRHKYRLGDRRAQGLY